MPVKVDLSRNMERHWYSDQGLELQVRVYRTRGKFNEYPQLLTPTPSSVSGTYLSGDDNSSGRCWGYLLNCLLRRTCRNRQRCCGKEDEEAQGKLRPQQTKKTCTNANKAKADTATPFTLSYALTKNQSLEALFIRYNDVSLKLGGIPPMLDKLAKITAYMSISTSRFGEERPSLFGYPRAVLCPLKQQVIALLWGPCRENTWELLALSC